MKLEPIHSLVLGKLLRRSRGEFPHSADSLMAELGLTAPEVGKALDQLEIADLVTRVRTGALPLYRITADGVAAAGIAEESPATPEVRQLVEAERAQVVADATSIITGEPEEEDVVEATSPGPHGKRGETREKIFALIQKDGERTSSSICEELDLSKATAQFHLTKLRDAGRVEQKGAGARATWALTAGGGSSPVAGFVRQKRAQKPRAKAKPRRSVSRNCMPAEALDALERQLKRPAVQRLEAKRELLARLSVMLDPAISALLDEISADLGPVT